MRLKHTLGEFRAPLIPCQRPPPIAPMEKAAPKSLRMTHGLMKGQSIVVTGLERRVSVPRISRMISVGHLLKSDVYNANGRQRVCWRGCDDCDRKDV